MRLQWYDKKVSNQCKLFSLLWLCLCRVRKEYVVILSFYFIQNEKNYWWLARWNLLYIIWFQLCWSRCTNMFLPICNAFINLFCFTSFLCFYFIGELGQDLISAMLLFPRFPFRQCTIMTKHTMKMEMKCERNSANH